MLDEKQELAIHLTQPDIETARKQRHCADDGDEDGTRALQWSRPMVLRRL